MIKNSVYFLAGLPRTGSTLLGSILGQNPDIHVTPTSPLCPLLMGIGSMFITIDDQYTYDQVNISNRIYQSTVDAFYADVKQPIVFDKNRLWPHLCYAISRYINPNPRIVCTVRPTAEIITSYLVLADADENNFIDRHLKYIERPITNANRAEVLWENYLSPVYECMIDGLKKDRDKILLIEYSDIAFEPEKTVKRVYDFCGIPNFHHAWDGIENTFAESKDEAWGLKNLHTIRPKLEKKSADPEAYLSAKCIDRFKQFDIRSD